MALSLKLRNTLFRLAMGARNNFPRCISTSPKNNETVCEPVAKPDSETDTKTATKAKNWVSYGFDIENEETDRNATNSTLFVSVTLCLVVGGFAWAYLPDFQLRDWAQREAFLEIRRREKLGLPLVDPNLIEPSKIHLPTDEELGDTEIII